MSGLESLYAGFVSSLPEKLKPVAAELPRQLDLSATPARAWGAALGQALVLEAPGLLAAVFPRPEPDKVRSAVFAHALSVIEACGRDRVAARQLRSSDELAQVFAALRRARDGMLESVWPSAVTLAKLADRETEEAIKEEHALLRRLCAVSFEDYRRISLSKLAVGFPATFALARSAGASDTQVEAARRALAGMALGLKLEDDAGDWEDDWRRGGGAWAVSLARRRLEAVKEQSAEERPTEPDLVRRRVHRMRVLYLMLRAARHEYRTAWRYARLLGAEPLALWTEQRLRHLDGLLPLEARHAGYVVRALKLAPWASEVLT